MSAVVTTRAQLRALYAPAKERSVRKQIDHLDAHCRRFIGLAPFVVLASSNTGAQMLDASPRGGEPGFVKVQGAHTLLLPDSPGNNRLDTLENILDTGRIGLLFLVPGVDETLRVNGSAQLTTDTGRAGPFCHHQPPAQAGDPRHRGRGLPALRQGPHALGPVEPREPHRPRHAAQHGRNDERPDRRGCARRDAGGDAGAVCAGFVRGIWCLGDRGCVLPPHRPPA